ncbi:hypothetical protein Tco_1183582 [Tanacetum coccineum]
MSMWIISRGVVLLILLMLGISFKFDISGLLHHVITTIAYRIRDKDTSQSKQNLQSSSMTFIHKTLIIPSVLDSCFISSTVSEVKRYSANMRRTVADFSHAPLNEYSPSPDDKKQWSLGCWFGGKLIQKLCQKGVYEESFSRHAAWIGGKLIQFMHTTMVPVQVKTMKIPRWIQVSTNELTDKFSLEVLWKTFISVVFIPDRNIGAQFARSSVIPRFDGGVDKLWLPSPLVEFCKSALSIIAWMDSRVMLFGLVSLTGVFGPLLVVGAMICLAVAVSGVPGDRSHVHTHDHDGSNLPDEFA